MTTLETIPHSGVPIENQAGSALRMAEISQSLMENPDRAAPILNDYRAELEDHYALMLHHNPGKADILIARKLRAALRGPMDAIVVSRLAGWLGERTEAERSICIAEASSTNVDYSTSYMNAVHHGAADRWMKAMFDLHDTVLYQLSCEQGSSLASDTLHRLESIGPKIYTQMADAYEAANLTSKLNWRKRSPMTDRTLTTTESITATFDIMTAGYIAVAASQQQDPCDANGVAETLLANYEPLCRLAGTNREVFGRLVSNLAGHTLPHEVYGASGRDLTRLESVFRFNGAIIPNHPSIATGDWPLRGNCVGRFLLRLPDPAAAAQARGLFVDLGHPEIGPTADGLGQAAHGLLGVGIEVARHTLFADENSPVIGRYALGRLAA